VAHGMKISATIANDGDRTVADGILWPTMTTEEQSAEEHADGSACAGDGDDDELSPWGTAGEGIGESNEIGSVARAVCREAFAKKPNALPLGRILGADHLAIVSLARLN